MRCKNCGWGDYPAGTKKCVKCNAQLSGSMVENAPAGAREKTSEDVHLNNTIREPLSTRATPTPDAEEDKPNKDAETPMKKCLDCGYPLMPSATECPDCGTSLDEASIDEPPKKELDTTTRTNLKLVGFLVTYCQSITGVFFPLYEGNNSIGRAKRNDIVIADKEASEEHFRIFYFAKEKRFEFEALNTKNGTFVNDKQYSTGKADLQSSDFIVIGSTKLTFIAIPETAFEKIKDNE